MTGEEFKHRFLPLSRKLFGVALRLTGNVQEAEDIVQDVYLKLWEKCDRLHGISNVEAYCIMTTYNVWHDRTRYGKAVNTVSLSGLYPVPSESSFYDRAEAKDYATIMRRQIDNLPPNQRKIITMRDVDGLDFNEIKQETGMNLINIRTTLSRARKTLREQFNILKRYEEKRH